jgi:hypothetical protein
MRLLLPSAALPLLTSAAALTLRQAPASIVKLPGSAWIENIIARSNGQLLLSRYDTNELWTLDPSTKTASKILSFAGSTALTGICEVAPDIFAVISGKAAGIRITSGSWGLWRVDLTGPTPKQTQLTGVPEAGFLLGCTAFTNDTIFVADAGKGALYKVDMTTGEYSVAAQDASMKPPASAAIQEGIHGVKYRAEQGALYFSNTFGNTFNKIKIDAGTGKGGTVTPILSSGLNGPEDFVLDVDGAVFLAQLSKGQITKVTADGKAAAVATEASSSSCVFGRGEKDKGTLYIATSNGAVFAQVVS